MNESSRYRVTFATSETNHEWTSVRARSIDEAIAAFRNEYPGYEIVAVETELRFDLLALAFDRICSISRVEFDDYHRERVARRIEGDASDDLDA